MQPRLHEQPSTPALGAFYPTSRLGILLRAEINLREAGRALECSIDPELQRTARVAFRLASRCRTERRGALHSDARSVYVL